MARAALVAELKELLTWRPALPAGDWRSWVADSHAIRDRAAFLVVRAALLRSLCVLPPALSGPQVRTLFCTFMNTVLLGYLLQSYLSHPLGFWCVCVGRASPPARTRV